MWRVAGAFTQGMLSPFCTDVTPWFSLSCGPCRYRQSLRPAVSSKAGVLLEQEP